MLLLQLPLIPFGFGSENAQRQLLPTARPCLHTGCGSEAVHVVVRALDSCRLWRLLALCRTAGDRQVVVLANGPNATQISDAVEWLSGFEGTRNIRIERPSSELPELRSLAWRLFGGARSHFTKAHQLLWLASSDYDRAWLVEDDVCATPTIPPQFLPRLCIPAHPAISSRLSSIRFLVRTLTRPTQRRLLHR